MRGAAIIFQYPLVGAIALLVVLSIVAIVVKRPPAVPRATLVLAGVGVLLLSLAAAGLEWHRPDNSVVSVLVDLSPSTRGAGYRETETLHRRIRELLGDTPFELTVFADGAGAADFKSVSLPDLPSETSRLPESEARAVLLFSDGRFSRPASLPPVYCVIDLSLDDARDARVETLDVQGDTVLIGVNNVTGMAKQLSLQGIAGEVLQTVDPGAFTISRALATGRTTISATLPPGDLWPENDALRANRPPPATAERWWVGNNSPDESWRVLSPAQLPTEMSDYLAAGVIVLNNIPADDLDEARQSALLRYVRDLGGGLAILGGDRAFAAGNYEATTLDQLSPLASTPPEPTTHWLLLADASGSMNQPVGPQSATRWQYAVDAVVAVARQLPPADLLSIGNFSDDVKWWTSAEPVTVALKRPLPPKDVFPRGQTNLDAALRTISESETRGLPTELLVATDAQASIGRADELAAKLKSRKIRAHVLLIDESTETTGAAALRTIAAGTGGTIRSEMLPDKWAQRLRELYRAAKPTGMQGDAATVSFLNNLAALPPAGITQWNRTWPRGNVTPLATLNVANEEMTMAARWNIGIGRVAAIAFSPTGEQVEAAVKQIARPPRDPRFSVAWEKRSVLKITVNAVEGNAFLNREQFEYQLQNENGSWASRGLPQTGPGRYELSLPAPSKPTFARLFHDDKLLDMISLSGRYAPEFDSVGNDRTALARLASDTGGTVIESNDARPLDLRWPRRSVSLVSFLASLGAAFIAAGLIRWRIGS